MGGEHDSKDDKKIPAKSLADANPLTEMLTHLIRVGNQLAAAPSVEDLCRQAVHIGLTGLGFERMSIWLVDSDRRLIRGTYGTDENGVMRDERSYTHAWADHMPELELLNSPQILFRREQAPLFNEANEVVGMGEIGAAALWNGEDVIGLMYMDNLLSQQPIREDHWRVFELYASTLGHLLSLKRTESALRSNEELLNQILDIMPVGVFVLSLDDGIARYNRAAQEIWELAPEAIDGWVPEAVWVHNRRRVELHEWAGNLAIRYGEQVLNQEVEVLKRDGSRHVLLNSGVPLRDSSGNLTGALIVNQDITESKRREQQLEALARLSQVLRPLTGRRGVLTAIVNQLAHFMVCEGVAIVLIDKEGQVIFEATQGDYASLIGLAVPEELTVNDNNYSTEPWVFDTAQSKPLCLFKHLEHNPRYTVIAPLISESSPVGALILGVVEAPDRTTLELLGALADVAAAAIQRGQLYDEVTTQANRLDRVMESVNFGLLLLDPQRRVVLANQLAQVRLSHLTDVVVGEELKELAGHRLGRFLTPRGNESHTQEIALDGSIYEITTVPVGATGAEGGWLMVLHDVTQDRSIQHSIQQHQRLAAVGQLAAGIAHDFNNIVAVITLYVQMLQRNPALQAHDHHRLNVIREQAQNASKLIRQILDFSRQTLIERQPADLKTLVEESVALWKRTLPESIVFRLEVELDGAAPILGEVSSLQQALTNLAVNARDAMPDGGELRVLLRSVVVGEDATPPVTGLKRGRWYEVYVIDNGMGISPEHLPHIFDPFFTTKEIGKGTGLGLAQVYGIVQQHGGLVTAQSEVGKGTSICLFLPALTEDLQIAQEKEPLDVTGEGSETILLVEDNAPAREATKALLEMLGYRVFAATDGRAGLDLFHRYRDSIQMVLSDLVMPEMGGLELYRKIHNENPAICVLIMTGYPLDDERDRVAEPGVVEWLQKPFTVKQLTVAVRGILERAKQKSEEQEEARTAKR